MKLFAYVSGEDDCLVLHTARWWTANPLLLNIDKCKVCIFTLKSQPLIFNYAIERVKVVRCNSNNNFGVLSLLIIFCWFVGYGKGYFISKIPSVMTVRVIVFIPHGMLYIVRNIFQ